MRLRPLLKYSFIILVAGLTVSMSNRAAFGQTTLFTFNGHLTDVGTGGNGTYDLQFALWDSVTNGAQVGTTLTINNVAVSKGDFTVTLDFGAGSFSGADRFVEIGARLSGSGAPFTVQTPRTQILSAPYAIRSLSSGSADSVIVTGVPSGSGNYIQNSTSVQPASNFNISGDGTTAGTLSASVVSAGQFNIGGNRVLVERPHASLFVGLGAGSDTGTQANSFFGAGAGHSITSAQYNSFFGFDTGISERT